MFDFSMQFIDFVHWWVRLLFLILFKVTDGRKDVFKTLNESRMYELFFSRVECGRYYGKVSCI